MNKLIRNWTGTAAMMSCLVSLSFMSASCTNNSGSGNSANLAQNNLGFVQDPTGGGGSSGGGGGSPVLSSSPANCLMIEAESGTMGAQSMLIMADPTASAGYYVRATPGTIDSDRTTSAANPESISYTFNIPVEADYVVWDRIQATIAADGSDDSFWVSSDVDAPHIYDNSECVWTQNNVWHWTQVSVRGANESDVAVWKPDYSCIYTYPRIFHFTAGTHSLTFNKREGDSRMDVMIITSDMSFNPNTDSYTCPAGSSGSGSGSGSFSE